MTTRSESDLIAPGQVWHVPTARDAVDAGWQQIIMSKLNGDLIDSQGHNWGHPLRLYAFDEDGCYPREITPEEFVRRTGKKGCSYEPVSGLSQEKKTETRTKVGNGEDRWEDLPDVVESPTGGRKGKKLARLSEIDPWALEQLAKVAGHGSDKYARLDFMGPGYDWSIFYDALQRHAMRAWQGEDIDQESGFPHFIHAAWCCLALASYFHHEIGTDDRFKKEES